MRTILNYRIIVEKETQDTGKTMYVTQVPTLGISDFGPTLEKALENTENLIKFHLECLINEKGEIPAPDDAQNIIVTHQKVEISPKKKFSFS